MFTSFFSRLQDKKTAVVLRLCLLGVVNSLLFSTLLLLINNGMQVYEASRRQLSLLGLLFFTLAVISYWCRRQFQLSMIRITNQLLLDYEAGLLKKVIQVDYESFSRMEPATIYTAINDIKVIAQLPRFFVDIVNNGIIIVVSLIYLFTISTSAALILILLIAALGWFYSIKNANLSNAFKQTRDLDDTYYQYLEDLIQGFRQIKLDPAKSHILYHDYLYRNRQRMREMEGEASVLYMNNELTGNFLLLAILGIIVFVFGYFIPFSGAGITSFVVTILYLMGPVSMLISSLPFTTRIHVSFQRQKTFLANVPVAADLLAGDPADHQPADVPARLTMENVSYSYPSRSDEVPPFSTGPLNIHLDTGEVIFITGSNGSGKSTFLLLLTGLLRPQTGSLYVDDKKVQKDTLNDYKQHFAVVFVDNFIFSENYSRIDLDSVDPSTRAVIDLLNLDPAKIRDRTQRSHLSKGQQKRLALIYALLEQKPILVLDEWAAEQDPHFRAFFYHQIIPALKESGKTVIAVTHDDKYFSVADRLIHFDKGQLVEAGITQKLEVPHEA
ncbi:MAG TPA: cyclic peptide export ABC transporter [Puia sp.]|uniref:cyclic peptide export ABC transporter n=1 Tax=Puia sp. TaxID=2045100 RepID=UPI002C666F97|nr:cyclic peptide export ABC transporter [Puia sp.]HVU94506.1 cyclic peptide export ABC transporter [Puia sp.]